MALVTGSCNPLTLSLTFVAPVVCGQDVFVLLLGKCLEVKLIAVFFSPKCVLKAVSSACRSLLKFLLTQLC